MDSIWFLFIFFAVVLLSYLTIFSSDNKASKAGANEELEHFEMPPMVDEPMYAEVGDDTELSEAL